MAWHGMLKSPTIPPGLYPYQNALLARALTLRVAFDLYRNAEVVEVVTVSASTPAKASAPFAPTTPTTLSDPRRSKWGPPLLHAGRLAATSSCTWTLRTTRYFTCTCDPSTRLRMGQKERPSMAVWRPKRTSGGSPTAKVGCSKGRFVAYEKKSADMGPLLAKRLVQLAGTNIVPFTDGVYCCCSF